MSNNMLYNRYRPSSFTDIVGNAEVKSVLQGLIKHGNYKNVNLIMSGPPGNSKTTTARIYAKTINCISRVDGDSPCNLCDNCLQFNKNNYQDYIEIDGTQYNKVEDMKRIKDLASQYPINPNGFRVITIDEAHVLSAAAWDIMLKLLEEGNNRTIFIFATTDLHKFRPAIVSRCFVMNVMPLSAREIAKELEKICKLEGINYSLDALNAIAYTYQGKPRDAIKTMDMIYKSHQEVMSYNHQPIESQMLSSIQFAFFNKFEEYQDYLDSIAVSNIFFTLSRTLNEVFMYPQIAPMLLKEMEIESFKRLIDNDNLKKIIKIAVDFKPDDIESFKLFLSVLASIGIDNSGKMGTQNSKGRRLINSASEQTPTKTPEPIKVEPKPVEVVTAPPEEEEGTVVDLDDALPVSQPPVEDRLSRRGFSAVG